MPGFIIYLLFLILELVFLISFSVFTIFLIYSSIKGSPYVPSKSKEIDLILKEAHFKQGQIFYDLGCGDGRIVRKAVKMYKVRGFGIDVNYLLIIWAHLLSRIEKIDTKFITSDLLKTDISSADVIYIFLMPALIKKVTEKFNKELKKEALVISHGFKIESWSKYLIKTLDHKPFPTYYYKP